MKESTHLARKALSLLLLVVFCLQASGLAAYAAAREARRDPAGALLQIAANPHVALTAVERERLRRTAFAAQRAQRSAGARSCDASCPTEMGLASMHALGGELRRLADAPKTDAAAYARLLVEIDAADREIEGSFAQARRELAGHDPGEAFWKARAALETHYRETIAALRVELRAGLRDSDAEQSRARLRQIATQLESTRGGRAPRPVDPKYRAVAVRSLETMAGAGASAPSGSGAATLSGSQPLQFAGAPPAPEDLAPSEDVQITPAIQALATSLGNDPLAIYEWVRNQVDFVPTWGSVQGSQLTYLNRSGNAVDTASLLIALLRAAGVPARYVVGTIDASPTDILSWLGGVADVGVAQQLLSSGGIGATAIFINSVLSSIRMDHVWVEAYIDYAPSRGAVQIQPDTWVPMDASYKLYDLTPASNLLADEPLDFASMTSAVLAGATVDPVTGAVSNIDDDAMFPVIESHVADVSAYTLAQGLDFYDTDTLFGSRTIATESRPFLAGSLPNPVFASTPAVATLPNNLRHTVRIDGFTSSLDRSLGFTAYSHTISLPDLNTKRLSLLFEPSTAADAAALQAQRDAGASSLSLSGINVTPTIRLDDVVLATGPSGQMGNDHFLDVVLSGPGASYPVLYDVIAGDEIIFGVTGNGFSQAALDDRLAANPVTGSPEYSHQIALHYWAESDALTDAMQQTMNVHALRLPSVGVFGAPLEVTYLFSFPNSGTYGSRSMDVKRSFHGVAGSNATDRISWLKQAGLVGSFMEAQAFDQFDASVEPVGVSAVHMINRAIYLGIPVYHITPANSAAAIPNLQLDANVEADISAAIAAGMTVLAPEQNIDYGGFVGAGYILIDESTGEGQYLISDGSNGGGLWDCIKELVPNWQTIVVAILLAVLIALLIAALGPVIAGVAAGAGEAVAAAMASFRFALFAFAI